MNEKKTVRRNKAIKACLNCRRKKQKCDQARPQCYQCRIRKTECVYLDGKADKNSISIPNSIKDTTPFEISHLGPKENGCKSEEANPLVGAKFIFEKEDRWLACGVTSMRTIFHLHCNSKINGYFTTAWRKLKQERNIWKAKNNYSSRLDWSLMCEPNILRNGESLIDAVRRVLPSYEEVEMHLQKYFCSKMHKTFEIVDPKKVMQDFRSYFIKGFLNESTGYHSISTFLPTNTKNFYRVGVILEILRISFFVDVPKELDFFSGYLTSSASEKAFNLEKLQCVMLKACYLDFTASTGGDFSRMNMLIQMACSIAINMGLNTDIEVPLCSNDKFYIQNLWWWILYMDIQVSFNVGIPLQISDISSSRLTSSSNRNRQDSLFSNSILMLRIVMEKIYDKNSAPNIKLLILDIKNFISKNFHPLPFYMTSANYSSMESREIHTLLYLLTTILDLSNLQRYYFHENSPETFNTTIQISFTSLYISITVLKSYFKMDISAPDQKEVMNSKKLPPHLQLGAWATYHLLGRVIYETYGLLFSTLQGSLTVSSPQEELHVCDFSIGSLNIPGDYFVSLKAVSQMLNSIFDMLYSGDCKELLIVLKRSYCFLVILSWEKISRTILRNGIMAKEAAEFRESRAEDKDESVQQDHKEESATIKDYDKATDLFWDHYDASISTWVDNDLEPTLSEWFGNFIE